MQTLATRATARTQSSPSRTFGASRRHATRARARLVQPFARHRRGARAAFGRAARGRAPRSSRARPPLRYARDRERHDDLRPGQEAEGRDVVAGGRRCDGHRNARRGCERRRSRCAQRCARVRDRQRARRHGARRLLRAGVRRRSDRIGARQIDPNGMQRRRQSLARGALPVLARLHELPAVHAAPRVGAAYR